MRRRDIALLLFCASAVIIVFLQEGTVSVSPAFHVPTYDSGTHHYVPPPVVTDLHGDGTPETVILRTSDELHVLPTHLAHRNPDRLFAPLEPSFKTHLSSNCIGLATGYLSFPGNMTSSEAWTGGGIASSRHTSSGHSLRKHKQHVAVVTDDYRLQLLDANLREVWAIGLVDPSQAYLLPRRASIIILPDRVYNDDVGIIVVCIQTMSAPPSSAAKNTYIGVAGDSGTIRWRHSAKNFANSVGSEEEQELLKIDKYKFTEKDIAEHSTGLDWTYFRESVVASMPHAYSHPWDTALRPFAFSTEKSRKKLAARHTTYEQDSSSSERRQERDHRRRDLSRHSEEDDDTTSGDYNDRQEVPTRAAVGAATTNNHNNRKRMQRNTIRRRPLPNVVASHTESGVQFIHLFTGRVVTEIGPLKRDRIYEDVDDDYRIDTVDTLIAASQEVWGKAGVDEVFHCDGTVTHDWPEIGDVESTPICDSEGYAHSLQYLRRVMRGDAIDGDLGGTHDDPLSMLGSRNVQSHQTRAVRPLVAHHRVAKGRGLYRSARVIVHMISSGHITAISGRTKHVLWRIDSESSFLDINQRDDVHGGEQNVAASWAVTSNEEKDSRLHLYPHLASYSFHTKYRDPVDVRNAWFARRRHDPIVLAVGTKIITLVDSLRGRMVTTVQLPSPPIAPVQIADFNGDGVNDLVVFTAMGYYGFTVERHATNSTTAMVLLVTMGCLTLLYLSQRLEMFAVGQQLSSDSGLPLFFDPHTSTSTSAGGGSDGRAAAVTRSKRSTD